MGAREVCPICGRGLRLLNITYRGTIVEIAVCHQCSSWIWFTIPDFIMDEQGEVADPEEFNTLKRIIEETAEKFFNSLSPKQSPPPYII